MRGVTREYWSDREEFIGYTQTKYIHCILPGVVGQFDEGFYLSSVHSPPNCIATADRAVVVLVKEFQWDQRPRPIQKGLIHH